MQVPLRQPRPDLLQQHWSPSTRALAGAGALAAWPVAERLPAAPRWALRGATAVLAVRVLTNMPSKRLTGVGAGPVGAPVRFAAEETYQINCREVAWRSADGELIAHTGAIRIDPEPSGRTRVQVQHSYNPPAGAVGHAAAWALRADPAGKLRRDLRRLKSTIEAGNGVLAKAAR